MFEQISDTFIAGILQGKKPTLPPTRPTKEIKLKGQHKLFFLAFFLFQLKELGYHNIDALDGVQEMLDLAKSKGIYKKYFCQILEDGKAISHIEESKCTEILTRICL